MKRGQLTTFIALGIAIVILTSLVLYYRTTTPPIVNSAEAQGAQQAITACLGQSADRAVVTLALQGWHLAPLDNDITVLVDKQVYRHSREEVQRSFNAFIGQDVGLCVASLHLPGIVVSTPVVSTSLSRQLVVKMDMPVKITIGAATTTLSSFIYSQPFDYEKIERIANRIVDAQMNDTTMLPIGALAGIALEEGFTYHLFYPSSSTVIITMQLPDAYKQENLSLNYIASFPTTHSSAITINTIPHINLQPGDTQDIALSTTPSIPATFSSLSPLATVNGNNVHIAPTTNDVGSHQVTIIARSQNATATETFTLDVGQIVGPVLNQLSDALIHVGQNWSATASIKGPQHVLFDAHVALPGFNIDPVSGLMTYTARSDAIGNHTVRVVATDDGGFHAEQSFDIAVI